MVMVFVGGGTLGLPELKALAYAQLAQLPPVYGLYSSIIPTIIYAFVGGSATMSLGKLVVLPTRSLPDPVTTHPYTPLISHASTVLRNALVGAAVANDALAVHMLLLCDKL
jgi:MFS superfamily sulfate permease-like transporter